MMDSWSHYHGRPTTSAEQALYDHLISCVDNLSPEEVIDRFWRLLINGMGYPDPEVRRSLEAVLLIQPVEKDLKFILNRSCHILINRWLMQPRLQAYIPELIALFELPPSGFSRSRTTQRLRELVQQFLTTEQYLALKRLAQVISQTIEERNQTGNVPLGSLIHRYPCLYEYTLLTEDSSDEQRERIRKLRFQAQRQFEIELSQYVTHQQRQRSPLSEVRSQPVSTDPQSDIQIIKPNIQVIKNPTLLSDPQLDQAIQFFTGRVDGCNTHRDLARQFLTYTKDTRSYKTFKAELYDYLTAPIDPKYGKRQFNDLLYRQLQDTLPQQDGQKMNDILLMTTCRKLLNFMVVEGPKNPNHFIFSDLTANVGITFTIGLLLKIVLLCSKVRYHLEKRFSILFSHYEACTKEAVGWLVESLENLNIALSTNFGSISLCY